MKTNSRVHCLTDTRSASAAVQLLILALLFLSQPAALTTSQPLCVASDASLFDPGLHKMFEECENHPSSVAASKGLLIPCTVQIPEFLHVTVRHILRCMCSMASTRVYVSHPFACVVCVCAHERVRVTTKPARWCMGITTHSHPQGLSLCLLEVHVYSNSLLMTCRGSTQDMCWKSDYKIINFREPGTAAV